MRQALGFLFLAALSCCAPPEAGPTAVAETSPVALGRSAAKAAAASPERLVIDTRLPADFARGHSLGALNLQWDWDQLRGRVRAYVPDLTQPIAVRASSSKELARALGALVEAGYTDVRALEPRPLAEVTELHLLRTPDLAARLAATTPPILIDVRTPGEWESGTIDGALLVEQDAAPALLTRLDPAAEYVVICEGGYRSSQLASLMRRSGFARVSNAIEGMAGWRRR